MVKRQQPRSQTPRWAWTTVIIILVILAFFSMVIAGVMGIFIGGSSAQKQNTMGNVAVIPVEGPLMTVKAGGFGAKAAVSGSIVKLIEKAAKDKKIKAIVLAINTPGGSAVASDEIAEAMKESNKTTVAWIRDIGTSGGYWVAASSDHIIAHPASITASIGVIGSYLEFDKFISQYNVTYRRLVSGKYKDIGVPFKQMTTEEEFLFQQMLDELHGLFVEHVAEDRNMPLGAVRDLATGAFMSGKKAHALGLVDELGGKKQVKNYLKTELNITPKFVTYKSQKGLLALLSQSAADHGFQMGRGIGSSLTEQEQVPGVQI